jgi:regulator of sigma E protease
MSVIIFLIILAVLIFVHELGHFLAAKKLGIRVDEFAIGFPPRLFGWTRGETKYSLNLIPFGGYVKIFGENPDEDSLSGPDRARSFALAAKWKQATILFAGVAFNFIFAWLLISASFASGLPTSISEEYRPYAKDVATLITQVQDNSPASRAGLLAGDAIVALKVGTLEVFDPSVSAVQETIGASEGPIVLSYRRAGVVATTSVEGVLGITENRRAIGIGLDTAGTVQLPIARSFVEGAKVTILSTKAVASGLYDLARNALRGEADFSQVSGPVGIVGLVGEASSFGIAYLAGFTALISINLAVLNLVPFPALDGGRLLFVAIEAIVRRPIPPKYANYLNAAGFVLLILLMIFVTVKDVAKLL